jgi:D-alanine-D-alanine ligase
MYGDVLMPAQQRAAADLQNFEVASELQQQIEQLLPRLRLAVIFGGDKSIDGSVVYQAQNPRSWKSYESVAEDIAASLRRIGFHHVELMPEDMRLGEQLRRSGIHMAWLNSGGVQGYNPAAHGSAMLEMLGIPYVGHDPLTATILDNKHAFKREAMSAGLPTAPFLTWHMSRGPFRPDLNSRFVRAFGEYSGPFVVKPVSGRASLHVHVVNDRESLPDAIAKVYRATDNVVLIEKYLPGREFCIAVSGSVTARGGILSHGHGPFAFGALERLFAPEELIFTSMDAKPITANRFMHVDAELEPELWMNIHDLARKVFLELDLGSLIRIDLRADESGQLHILEANPKPDLKRPSSEVTSLISAGLSQTGLDYDNLILSLLADRLDFLFSHRRGSIQHILDLLDCGRSELCNLRSRPGNASDDIDAMVLALNATGRQMKKHEDPERSTSLKRRRL